ncbi:protein dopey-2 isoform X2 [Planococcus citri]|uniref:protein dopey-2 isoform X2 n=1 Tax=Planococcus citri TaxID=170843 RepID=UPI0031F8059D
MYKKLNAKCYHVSGCDSCRITQHHYSTGMSVDRNKKFKKYVTSIDKALKSFEYTSDWADLISFLGKLNKILLNHTKYPVIPRRMKISKRLAQCLHPHLPSGVHLKALDTYDIMFRTMGTNRLSQELFIYGSGLFPLLGHAYTNVKQCLLTIYETHFVPLGERLVPGLNGFLSGVLPGLEEGTDYYERTNSLLEKVCMGVNPSVFYTCLWECLTSNAAVRLPAISFILSHFDKHLTMKEQMYLMGNDVELMVNGLCTCFQDSSVLIQRSALDFLLAGFPMHNNILSKEHCQLLLTSVLVTLLRRDMSLNRRLYAWLLGSDITSNSTSPSKDLIDHVKQSDDRKLGTADQYFKAYSKELLISAIQRVLKNATCENPHDLRPYRILISLLDKSDIGPVILDDILFEVFRLLYLSWKDPGSKASNGSELLKSANLLFSSLEPRYLWQYVGVLFSDACRKMPLTTEDEDENVKPVGSGDPALMEVCSIIIFLLDSLSLEIYSETFSEYLPDLFLHIITSLNDHCDTINAAQVAASLKLCLKILSKVRSPVLISHTASSVCDNYDNENYTVLTSENKMAEPGKIIQLQTSDLSGDKSDKKRPSKPVSSPNSRDSTESSIDKSESDDSTDQIDDNLVEEEVTSMEKCLEHYKKFYVTFIYGVRLKIGETRNISSLFKLLLVKSPDAAAEDKAKYLELLLREILCRNSRQNYSNLNSFPVPFNSRRDLDCGFSSITQSKKNIGMEWKEAVAFASKLLIELSTFQTSVPSANLFNDTQIDKENVLPEWLKSIIICSCWLGNIAVPLQLVAISTLLDLALLCRRSEMYTQHAVSSNSNNSSSNQVVTVVVFVPLLTPSQLLFIEYQTNVFQVIIHWLWLHLGDPTYEVKCAELICQLQNTLNIPNAIENCIGDSLSHLLEESKRLEAFRKFVKLWHISREVVKCSNTPHTEDTFYKCMLKILDVLPIKESNCLKIEAESWLFHSLMRGDCARIVEPLLLILIERNTARVSISHAKIQQHLQSDNQSLDSENSAIFAICSTFGNPVTYHLIQNILPSNAIQDTNFNVINNQPTKNDSIDDISIKSSKSVNAENVPCREYVKKLPFLQNISVFIDRGSIDDAAEVSQTVSEFDSMEDRERSISASEGSKDSLQRFNTLPLIKDKLGSMDTIKCNTGTGEMKKSRSFVSDNGFSKENIDDDSKNGELVRSLSFSGRDNTNTNSNKNTSFAFLSNGKTEGINIAKAVIEDVLTEIVDNVVGGKKSDKSIECEKEEEADSAISCNSGCSSVTLEYEKEDSYADEEETRCRKYAEIDNKQLEKFSSNLGAVQFYSHMLLYCDLYDTNRILYTLNKFRDILTVNAKAFLFATSTTVVPSSSPLVHLLLKHRNSIFARGFQCEEKSMEAFSKNTTYLEVLITICLYYVRSYYPNSGNPKLTEKEIFGNKQVQLASIELLSQIFFQLCGVVQSNKNEMAPFIRELLSRCKVQKIALHCVWCCLYDDNQNLHLFIKEILVFNRKRNKSSDNVCEYNQAFQIQFLRLLLSLIVLENDIYQEENTVNVTDNDEDISIKCDYICDRQIIQQPLFLHLLKKMLEPNPCARPNHERVISFIITCLPYFKKSLPKIVVKVIRQICWNIEVSSDVYIKSVDYRMKQSIPFNYMVILLDALTILSHYCVLDQVTQLMLKPVTDTTSLRTFNGLFQMYSDFPNIGNFCNGNRNTCPEAKESVLHNLPKIFFSVSTLWQTITSSKQREYENVAGSLLVVKSQILNLLNPIAVHHSMHFFVSVAIVWKDKRSFVISSPSKMTVVPEASKDQSVLVHLISSLNSVSPDILMNTMHRIIKQQFTFGGENSTEIEISALEVLVHYIQLITIPRLMECWNCLLPLLKEAPNVSTRSQFLLCAAVSHFVNRMPSTPDRLMDKKDFKDLQDIIIKMVELCTQIAGAGLEQTTWLRRNLAVRENDSSSPMSGVTSVLTPSLLFSKDSDKQNSATAQFSVAAQLVLAELLIPLLDTVYTNQDKEKLVTLLINVMYNITPYLKNHTQKNANSFYACSQLVASISGYQYTRKAWRKDVMDLLLDSSLFQMEVRSLRHWRVIVDNLMSQDISSFRDLLSRVPLNQNNALNLFSSKDQEYEQRSQVLKRLAFVILCSEQDQFHKHMPDIQEKITDSLKLPQSTPGIQAQVFLCFRVLLLRMSSHHITSLWPAIITEMVQVMLQMEHELSTDTEEFGNNGLHASGHPHWLQLQLAAAKLLKLAVQLPADRLPQFQMYRWAFVGSAAQQSDVSKNLSFIPPSSCAADFVPHVVRIASLMNNKFGESPPPYTQLADSPPSTAKLLPSAREIRALQDLQPFFTALSRGEVGHVSGVTELEEEIELDFLEQLPYSSSSQLK